MAKKKQKTTRDTSFNFDKDVNSKTIYTLSNYTATKEFPNITLMGAEDGMSVKGAKIIEHANANKTMKDMGYNITVHTDNITTTDTYKIYGAPFQAVLNNRQHYYNCGVESTLNTLATAGKIKMKENLSDQKSVEKSFLKKVWTLGLVNDAGVIGKLDEPDGGTEPDDYRDILRQYDIDSEAYFISTKCDDTQYNDINELAYKISQGYGAVLGVCSSILWQEQMSETDEIGIDHAVAIVGVVYAEGVKPYDGTVYGEPKGFYIHDSGAWMTRYITLAEFKEATLYDKHGMLASEKDEYLNYEDGTYYDPDKYCENLRDFNAEPEYRQFIGKQPNGLFVTITSEPIKSDMFNINATGDKQNNTIVGNSGDNVIKGMDGKDTLYGNAGDDEIRGGKGNDVIIGNNISEDIKTALNDMFNFGIGNVNLSDTYQEGINKLYGDAGNDIIIGGDDVDLIYGGAGDDKIYAGNGRNAVYGGKGKDLIVGGWENDRLLGDAGNDVIYGWGDDDTIHGGDGNDKLYGGSGNDRIETGKGTDIVYFEGTEHGIDEITSQGGSTTFQFIDEVYDGVKYSDGAKISDMYFSLAKDEENSKKYDFGMAYTPDDDSVKDGVKMDGFFNFKKNTSKSLTIVDVTGESYKVAASKSAKVKASGENNVLFSVRDKGAEITTSAGNDIVIMTETEDVYNRYSDSELVYDAITYTGGNDRYVSEERNTYYYVDNFGSATGNVTNLAIYDNIKALEKGKVGPDGTPVIDPVTQKPVMEEVVSTDDRLYINTTLSNVGFFFDVTKNGDLVYTSGSLYALDKEHINSDIYIDLAEGDSITGCGMIDMESFFGNGKIESLYTKENGADYTKFQGFDDYIANATSAVAGWLAGEHNKNNYTSAFEAISSNTIEAGDFDLLVACYTVQA